MIFVLVVLTFCAVIFVMANSANNNYQQYLRKVADGERLWTVDAYDNRSLLTGEKLGHNIAINGDSIYYGLDSHELIVNETEYQLLHMRLKAMNEGKSYFYFGNNKNYYKIDVKTGGRYVLSTKIGNAMQPNKHIENPNDFYNVEYWQNPIIKNDKYKVTKILEINSKYEVE